jgi:lysophospholipase L1-like esterase
MRVLKARGDWRPNCRIEGLVRYAFIGDSTAYGAGVAPNQTLSAQTERQMNELVPGWPVEAVNFGVSGYNLWNSWLAFKNVPQVYDGVVIVLCNNDADLFDSTYQINYTEPNHTRWIKPHPFNEAVANCFDDIASFSKEHSLHVAVIYSNSHNAPNQLQIGEVIGDLCPSRGFCYIDTRDHYVDRNFAWRDLVVSDADFHPSAMAHEAIGRHLALSLRRQGWFTKYLESPIGSASDRILSACKAMVEDDVYPTDAALNWALHVLDTKSRLARRLQASGRDDDFTQAAEGVTQALTTASVRWQMAHRLRAFIGGGFSPVYGGAGGALIGGEEARLKLEELSFALGTGKWPRLSECSLDLVSLPQSTSVAGPPDAQDFFNHCLHDIECLRKDLDRLRSLAAPAVVGWPYDEVSILSDIGILLRFLDRAQVECTALKAAFRRIEEAIAAASSELSEERISQVSGLARLAFENVKRPFGFLQHWSRVLERITATDYAPFSTVEVTFSTEALDGKVTGLMVGHIEYTFPQRLPFNDMGSFLRDGSQAMLKLHFPTFYGGRIGFRTFTPRVANPPLLDFNLVKVEVYNRSNQRHSVDPTSFYKHANGNLVSPLLYLS